MAPTPSREHTHSGWWRSCRYSHSDVLNATHLPFILVLDVEGALIIEDDAAAEGLPLWYTEMDEMIVKI